MFLKNVYSVRRCASNKTFNGLAVDGDGRMNDFLYIFVLCCVNLWLRTIKFILICDFCF